MTDEWEWGSIDTLGFGYEGNIMVRLKDGTVTVVDVDKDMDGEWLNKQMGAVEWTQCPDGIFDMMIRVARSVRRGTLEEVEDAICRAPSLDPNGDIMTKESALAAIGALKDNSKE